MVAAETVERVHDANAEGTSAKLTLLLQSVTFLAEDVRGFEFVDPNGCSLPPFTAGSHVDVHLPNGVVRQYSLCNAPAERHRYVVAVLREPNGRGGSIAMHDQLRPGSRLTVSIPRNHFELEPDASRYVFVAGGIGITPIMAMIAHVCTAKRDFRLYYCARTPERAAFADVLRQYVERGQAALHFDGGDPERCLNLKEILRHYQPGTHLYYCGPGGFLKAVDEATAHWPAQSRHSERFSAPEQKAGSFFSMQAETEFEVKLAKTRKCFKVRPGESIVHVLQANGVDVDVSCQQGYCGTCMTRYLAGEPQHRDSVLDDEDRREFMMICCSRSRTPELVLDL